MIESNGRLGYILTENNVLTFQMGEGSIPEMLAAGPGIMYREPYMSEGHIVEVRGYRVLTRGANDMQIEDVSKNIKGNRLLPEVIEKQVKILFGEGLNLYKPAFRDGKLQRDWTTIQEVSRWLNSWEDFGIIDDYQDLAIAQLRRYYSFEDFFTMWRFSMADVTGRRWCAGLELVENSKARLATDKNLGYRQEEYAYSDFDYIAVGDWRTTGDIKVYPRLDVTKVDTYNVAISHHANDDIDSLYGRNKSYEGSRQWVEAANENPRFIRSFLRNSLAAKLHVVIPNEWLESQKARISSLCQANKEREREGKELFTLNGIDIGTKYTDAALIKYTNKELEKLTQYLSGADNQGKLFSTFSYQNAKGDRVEWKIESLDLKYKEYIESLLLFDRRADEVLVGSVGLDPSISNVSKEGIISKSGSDAYYNYIIYQTQLTAPEKICCDPFNMALRVNFPHLYADGFRFGFYRNAPMRQQDISPDNRLTAQ